MSSEHQSSPGNEGEDEKQNSNRRRFLAVVVAAILVVLLAAIAGSGGLPGMDTSSDVNVEENPDNDLCRSEPCATATPTPDETNFETGQVSDGENNSTNSSVSDENPGSIEEPSSDGSEPVVSSPTPTATPTPVPSGRVINLDQNRGYDEIQPAIDDANSGDTIRVKAGRYSGKHEYQGYGAVAVVDKSVTLVADDGVELTGYGTTDWANSPSSAGFLVTADDVTIQGFTGTNHFVGIGVLGANNVVVENNAFDDGDIFAANSNGASLVGNDVQYLSVRSSSGVTMRDNTVSKQLAVNNGADGAYVSQNTVEWLFVSGNSKVEVDGNSITRVEIRQASSLDFHDNTVSGSNEYGVKILHSTATLSDNVITGNNGGILVTMVNENFPASDVTIRYNQVYDNNAKSSVNLGDVALDDERATFDARQNYWGQASGPYDYQIKQATQSYPDKIAVSDHCQSQGCSGKR